MPLVTGAILQDRYRVVALLGQGGMGAVYRAWDLRLKVSVALKEQMPQPGLEPELLTQLRQQFEQEAVTLARLSHPHLVRVTDFFEEGGNAYLVMDFLEGESLADRITREGIVPEAQVLDWTRQLLDALTYCHTQGIVHRDIKPQNILLRPDGRAVLVDFGLVKLWNPNDPQTRTVMRGMGTPEYAPPEQYGQRGQTTDPRSDLYSLGATLYHALTGQAPPTASDRMADPQLFQPVRAFNPTVNAATEAAILRALEPVRDGRWSSAAQMLAALPSSPAAPAPQQQPHRPATPFTVPMPQPAQAPARRAARPAMGTWVGGAVVALVVLAVSAFWLIPWYLRTQASPTPAPIPAPVESRRTPTATAAATATRATPPAPEPTTVAGAASQFPRLAGKPRIAALVPLSGDVAIFGQSARDGVLLAVAEWNASGNAVEVIFVDSQCNPQVAVSAANKVIDEDGVKFIIGEVCSSASIPISEIASERGVLQISPTSTNLAITVDDTGATKPLIFRTCFIDTFQGTVGARFALETLNARTAAVFLDESNAYVRGLAKFFIVAFEAGGGTVVVRETYSREVTDFSPLLNQVKAANPDILYLPDYYDVVNLIAAQARDLGVTATFMGGDGWDSPDLDTAALEGGYFTNHFSPEDPRPEVQAFVQAYQAAYGTLPDAISALGYDAAHVLLQAMADAGNTSDPAAVARALESGTFNRVTGQITFDSQHNPVKHGVILHVENGAVHPVANIRP